MRHLGRLLVGVGLACGLVGCGGTTVQEGIPKGVDMSKTYSPSASVAPIRPGDAKKSGGGDANKGGAMPPVGAPSK